MGKQKYKLNTQGYYSTLVWDGTYDEYGRKHRVAIRSKKSSADLEKKVKEFSAKVEAGTVVRKSETTFEQYAAEWLKTKSVLSRNTVRQYKDILKYTVNPLVGSVKICEFSKIHFQQLISANAKHPRTCQIIKRTVMQIAESAVDDHLLNESVIRPLKSVQLPKYQKQERRVLTDAEKNAVFTAELTQMQKCFVYLLRFCGLRRGEALGLTPLDCDLSRLTVRVCRSVEFINNKSSIKSPKSQRGFRTVPMPQQLADFLKEYLPTVPGGYLIHKADGGLMTQSSFRRMWESIIRKMNIAAGGTDKIRVISGLTPHIFRHTLCTEYCYQVPTVSTKKIASIMGHDESMVIRVYSHILEEKEDAPGALAKIFAV